MSSRRRKLPPWMNSQSNMSAYDYFESRQLALKLGNRKVVYLDKEDDINAYASELCSKMNDNMSMVTVGFDMEWPVDFSKGCPPKEFPTSLMQIAPQTEASVYLLHLRAGKLPDQLRELIEHPLFMKVGLNIVGDIRKLGRDFNVAVDLVLSTSIVELGDLARSVLRNNTRWSLAGLVSNLLDSRLPKDPNIRCSDWSRSLSSKQIKYAALDAFASLTVYEALVVRRDAKKKLKK